MSANPVFFVDGPQPIVPKHRLVDVPGVLIRLDDPHWQLGIRVWPFPDDPPVGWDPCSEGTYRPKADPSAQPDNPEFSPITIVGVEACSTFSVHDQEAYKARAEAVFEAGYSAVVEQQLAEATWVTGNPRLTDAPTQINGGAATAAASALAALENAIGATHKGGVIHADPATVTAWAAQYLVYEEQGTGVLRTVRGTPVAVEDGLIGAIPDGEPALSYGQSWAWATGMVHVLLGARYVLPEDVAQALDRELNLITYRVEAAALPYWDTTLNTAALVNWNA